MTRSEVSSKNQQEQLLVKLDVSEPHEYSRREY